jgi:acyl phosphate:glycerol-3-phosphate acyltransferase
MVLDTAKDLFIDLYGHARFYVVDRDLHNLASIPSLTIFFKSGRMAAVTISIVLSILAAYLAGSIPFGYLIPKALGTDIRRLGSGNIGATNVFRILGPLPGSIVFVLDLAKGALPLFWMQSVTDNPWLVMLAGLAAVLGHTFPVFLKFKGGRGAATGLGVLLAISPEIFIGALIFAAVVILISRYVSLASITTPPLITLAFILFNKPLPYTIVAALLSLLIILRHIPNIKRLLKGTESRIGGKI